MAGSPLTPLPPSPVARAPASCTTSRGARASADLPSWIELVGQAGVPNSGYVDRHYFHSLYFREAGGVLYELATGKPGFLVDGLSVQELGTKVILPPFLDSRRDQIEQILTPLPDPRADSATAVS